ncbi:MAG: S9 family peptidase, partial [Saprospiraceae bacterium]
VWTETGAVMEAEKSEMLTQVWLGRVAAPERIQLTFGEKSAAQPSWSPDGKFVYFLRGQIHRIAIDGGDAESVTAFKGTIASFQLSPDGKSIAFTGRETDADLERAKREKRDFKVIDENSPNASLYIVTQKTARKIAAGPWHVTTFDWSPDSQRIAFDTQPTAGPNDAPVSDLIEVDVESGKTKVIANTPGSESSPRYSSDGRYLAFLHVPGHSGRLLKGTRIALLHRANGSIRNLPPSFDESPALLNWSKDNAKIYFQESRGTRTVVYAAPLDGPVETVYAPAGILNATLNRAGTHFGFASHSSGEPAEAYVLPLVANTPFKISAANTAIPKIGIAETRLIQWKAKDGKQIEGLLTLPLNYQAGKAYPMILNIHGGPAGAFNEGFIGAPSPYPLAAFAENGYAILRPNPRGSSAYGHSFRIANRKDWGGADYHDIMAGVDEVIRQGIADPQRLAVMGWSYGGYMTNWVITQNNRFKCAVTGAGISNMPSMWGTNDIPGLLDEYFSGAWYDQPELYAKLSPIYHVKNVTTPTLFLHGEADTRVPITQAYEMHSALERLGIKTEMVVYPRTQHGVTEPKFLQDVMQRHFDWVEKFIGAPR